MVQTTHLKIKTIIALLIFCCSAQLVTAAVVPPSQEKTSREYSRPHVKAKQIEKLLGKKLTLVDKIKLQLLQRKLGRYRTGLPSGTQRKQAAWSMALGIASILLLFTPLGILAIPAAVVGLVLGIISLKGNSNTQGIVGVITSSVTLLLIIVAIIVVAIVFASFFG